MNRGVDRADIFRDDRDRVEFGAALGEARTRADVEVHASALMGNHFHLLVRDRPTDLSVFMHHLGTTYGRRFNDRHGRDGPLFRNRFHSIVIGTDQQLLRTLRYVHLNPVAITGLESLEGFRWSSHRSYLGLRRSPQWLVVDHLLGHFADVGDYHSFVCGDVETPPTEISRNDIEFATTIALADAAVVSGSIGGVVRDVGLVLEDRHPGSLETVPDRSGRDASPSTLRAARSRARKRLRHDPAFRRLIGQVELMLQLGPVPRCNAQAERSSPARSWAA